MRSYLFLKTKWEKTKDLRGLATTKASYDASRAMLKDREREQEVNAHCENDNLWEHLRVFWHERWRASVADFHVARCASYVLRIWHREEKQNEKENENENEKQKQKGLTILNCYSRRALILMVLCRKKGIISRYCHYKYSCRFSKPASKGIPNSSVDNKKGILMFFNQYLSLGPNTAFSPSRTAYSVPPIVGREVSVRLRGLS